MRLHNRLTKVGYFSDGELLRWPRTLREFYRNLWSVADDSGCLEDDPFEMKIILYPSPRDGDITEETCKEFVRILVEAGKAVRYYVGDKGYLYITNFSKHQRIDNPSAPDAPLPEWITWATFESNQRKGRYVISYDVLTQFLQSSSNITKPNVIQENIIEPNLNILCLDGEPKQDKPKRKPREKAPKRTDYEDWFEAIWKLWLGAGRVGSKPKSYELAQYWRNEVGEADLLEATRYYLEDECAGRESSMIKLPESFMSLDREYVRSAIAIAKGGKRATAKRTDATGRTRPTDARAVYGDDANDATLAAFDN